MPIIREKIKYIPVPTGTTQFNFLSNTITGVTGLININFGLTAQDGFLGYQQEIDNLTQVVGVDLVNPEVDVEERKVKYIPNIGPITLQFNFHTPPGNAWANTFAAAGFSYNDTHDLTPKFLNSFFIMDFYDTYDTNTQTKIFTTYLTKIMGNDSYGNKVYAPSYVISQSTPNQLYYWYVPQWYLDAQTGSTFYGYAKFTFYNAISGTTALFYNYDNEALISGYMNSQKMYFKTEISRLNKTWKIQTPPSHANVVIARELWNSPEYSDKVDNTVPQYNNEVQNYPSGNTFNYKSGRYVTI